MIPFAIKMIWVKLSALPCMFPIVILLKHQKFIRDYEAFWILSNAFYSGILSVKNYKDQSAFGLLGCLVKVSVVWLISLLHQGSSVPLVVKWADTEKERQARKAQKAQSQASNVPNADSQHPSIFGALPMGYVPPYNGYGYQVNLVIFY